MCVSSKNARQLWSAGTSTHDSCSVQWVAQGRSSGGVFGRWRHRISDVSVPAHHAEHNVIQEAPVSSDSESDKEISEAQRGGCSEGWGHQSRGIEGRSPING